ncbi:MAG TPA: hypothetical protein VF880_10275, partial [Actinomycetes bacterium]
MAVTAGRRPARPRWWTAGLAWALWALVVLSLALNWWQDRLLRQAGRPDLAPLGGGVVAPILAAVSAGTVGAVLASRRPRHPVGWLLLAFALSANASGLAEAYADYGLLARPGTLPAARYVALYLPATILVSLTSLGFVLLLTPTGSLPSPSWRWWARLTAAAPVVSLLAITLAPHPFDRPYQAAENPLDLSGVDGAPLLVYQVGFAVTNLAVLVGAASLVVRFRRAGGMERQQLRWVALAAALVALGSVVVLAAFATGADPGLLGWVAGFYVAVLPLAIGAAILRYRLYDLDRIISRVLAYGLLTVLLGGAYAAVVLGLGQRLGRGSSLAVAGATLAVFGLSQPARRRIQAAVDRRFNRRHYDAAQTIQAFSERLRQHVDLDALNTELLAVVDQAMQPTQVSL